MNSPLLQVLRGSLDKLEQMCPPSRGSMGVREELEARRRHKLYQSEIKQCREIVRKEGEQERLLAESILQNWTLIKELRKSVGYQTTPLQLVIHKKEIKSKKQDERKIKELFHTEVEEIFAERQAQRNQEMELYRAKLKEYKNTKKRRVRWQENFVDNL